MTQSLRHLMERAGSGKRPADEVTRGPRAPRCRRTPASGPAVLGHNHGSYRVLVSRPFPPQMRAFRLLPLGNGKTAQKLHRQKPKLLQVAWAQRDLNPRPSDYESPALTAALPKAQHCLKRTLRKFMPIKINCRQWRWSPESPRRQRLRSHCMSTMEVPSRRLHSPGPLKSANQLMIQ